MKKLSEFENEKGIEIVADIIPYIAEIASNPKNKETKGNAANLAASMLKNNATAVKGILAVLNETPENEYNCNAASVLVDVLTLLSDEDFMQLFGLQSKTAASSGSVSENGKGQKE